MTTIDTKSKSNTPAARLRRRFSSDSGAVNIGGLLVLAVLAYTAAWSQGMTPTIQNADPAKGGTLQSGFAHGYANGRCNGGSVEHCEELARLRAENLANAGVTDAPEVAQS